MISKKIKSDIQSWEKIAPRYIKFIKMNKNGYLKYILYESLFANVLSLADGVRGKEILDAGCGEGRLCRMLSQRGAKLYGFDASETMINEAQSVENKKKQGITYFKHDLTLPLPESRKYDIVIANMVLFNIEDLESVVKNLSRVTKTNGKIILSLLHPCFNITRSQWFNLRKIGAKGGSITFEIKKSYKDQSSYKKDYTLYGGVNYYHRPIETYIKMMTKYGYLINNFLEPILSLNQIYDENTYHHHYLPRYLLISGVKAATKA